MGQPSRTHTIRHSPGLGNNWSVVAGNLDVTPLLMQQSSWPYCTEQQQCRCPNVAHCADIALSLGESANALPQAYWGEKLFNVLLMIFEVEGGKDVWGCMEQESKAMREIVSSLSVMGEAYLGFVYPVKISLWKAMRNPAKSSIDIEKEDIYREGNRGGPLFSLPKDNLWLGVDPPRGQRSCGGK